MSTILMGGLARQRQDRGSLGLGGLQAPDRNRLNDVVGERRHRDVNSRMYEIGCSDLRRTMEMLTRCELPITTIYGSARFKAGHSEYERARNLAYRIASNPDQHLAVMTGAGPGIMEAGNQGAAEVTPSKSWGVKIDLENSPNRFEQNVNPFIPEGQAVRIQHFWPRKTGLVKGASACVAAAGGFGTLDELFENLAVMDRPHARSIPNVLMGAEFWQPVISTLETWVRAQEIKAEKVSEFMGRFPIVDTPEQCIGFLRGRGLVKRSRGVDETMIETARSDFESGHQQLAEIKRSHACVAIHGGWRGAVVPEQNSAGCELSQLLSAENVVSLLPTPTRLTKHIAGVHGREGINPGVVTFARRGEHTITTPRAILSSHEFTAEVLSTRFADASVFFPGGASVLAALFEQLTLRQLGKMEPHPMIAVGSAWRPFIEQLGRHLAGWGTIKSDDFDCLIVADTVPEAVRYLRHALN